MQLNEILEEHSIKAMSAKTNISEENIEMLLAEDFLALSRAKALGFISIIERDYGADLSKVKEQALAYYDAHQETQSINLVRPVLEEKKGSSKWVFILVLALLVFASWYFFTQFDKKHLNAIFPFSEGKTEVIVEPQEEKVEEGLSIQNALSATQTDATGVQTDIVEMSIEPRDANVNVVEPMVLDTPDPV